MPKPTFTHRVLEYVKANPGTGTEAIIEALPEVKPATLYNILARLQREGAAQNRGGINRFEPARWYPNDPFISEYAQKLARDIYEGMMQQHGSVREQFLAERLDELFAEQRGVTYT
jgi:hypothetical protein